MSDFLRSKEDPGSLELRGSILRLLARSLFKPLTDTVISLSLRSDPAEGLSYLQCIGYISIESGPAHGGPMGTLIRLTAKGVDAIEGSLPMDTGIVL